MNSTKNKNKPSKPKNRFTICCLCLNSSSSDIELNKSVNDDEAYDFVVEKLAIKRVPISLFATEEDLAEIQNIRASSNNTDYPFTSKDKKSAMIFSSCYSKIKGNNSKSNHEIREIKTKNKNVLDNRQQRTHMDVIHKAPNYRNIESSKDSFEDEIGDTSVEYKNSHAFPVSVEVHSEPSVKTETKKFFKLSPELHETLQELGSKPKPTGHPGVVPRVIPRPSNQISVVNRVSVEKPVFEKYKSPARTSSSDINTDDMPRTLSFHKRLLKRLFPSTDETSTNVNETETVPDSRTTDSNDLSTILSTFANKSNTNQKWKIIIKEHEDRNINKETEDAATQQCSGDNTSSSEYSTSTGSSVSETE